VSYDLGDRTRIGRLGENEIQVPDANVSRTHAEILRERHAYIIYDRGSRNGVIINGKAVSEKILLKNDEIQIGGTTFLFNSDLNIRNARYSNNSVYIYPTQDDTLHDARTMVDATQMEKRERESMEFVLRFAEMFSSPPAPLSVTANHLTRQVMELFNADSAILFLRDYEGADLRPVVALPETGSIGLNKAVMNIVRDERHALLSSEETQVPPNDMEISAPDSDFQTLSPDDTGGRTSDGSEFISGTALSSGSVGMTTMASPIFVEEQILGIFVIQKEVLDFYTLRDLGLLQAVCKLAGGIIEASKLSDFESICANIAHEGDEPPSRSLRMQEIYNAARRTAESDVTVLISGETGTGKEVLARHIHKSSPRSRGPFIAINCGAIPPNLFESELFGYEKGAFTGAVRTTPGKIEAANGGTLFLDEIGELDIALQPKLLRFLQDKVFYRVGGNRAIETDARIIAATNVDLAASVRAGSFREDLWYRLNVVPFVMPPLRERREDIAMLVDFMISKFAIKLNKKVLGANDTALALLQKYEWPGNIRELENAVERAVLLADGKVLTTNDFSHIDEARRRAMVEADMERKRETKPLADVERQHIIIALKKFNYNQARAAEALGLHRNTLRNKIVDYGIEIPK
jgi:transcriptional regulator with GAF, ATPase, and Fis domain/pSer/pThr/pTyr-binding forkhead associated (FHA) protein